jgi:large-conductance mechanosensitive channel
MDIFFLGVIGFVLVAFIVFVVASLRLERSHLAEKTPKPEVFGDENNIHRRA